jgi:superfamily II DNA/RNA helicase
LPKDHKDYIHRIGRTARAGAEGVAVNILASRDYDNFSNIMRHNEGLAVAREMTPRFEKIFVKFSEPRASKFGGVHGRAARGRGQSVGGRRPEMRRGRGDDDKKPKRSGVDSRGRQERGDRNKRSNNSGGRDGFRGGGRNVRTRRDRH